MTTPPPFPEPPNYPAQPTYQPQPPHGQPAQPGYSAYSPAYTGPAGPGEPFDGATSAADLSRPLYGASFGAAATRFLKNYMNFSGRASRSEYWWAVLFAALLLAIPTVVYIVGISAAGGNANNMGAGYIMLGGLLTMVITLGLLLPSMALAWRRLHDADLSGALFLLILIPTLGAIALFVMMLLPSKPQGRRFDEHPRG